MSSKDRMAMVPKSDQPREAARASASTWTTLEQIRARENPKRGLGKQGLYVEAAVKFVKEFPVGGRPFPAAAFDAWAARHGYLEVPPPDTPRKSDTWQAHCQRRHHLKYNMVKASAHSRMRDNGVPTFAIELGEGGQWQVVAPQDAFLHDKFGRAVHRLYRRKGRKYAYLLQSADWAELEAKPKLSAMIESYYFALRGSERRLSTEVQILLEEGDRIEREVQRALESGDITPRNGGIRGMLTEDNDTEVDEEDISGADVD